MNDGVCRWTQKDGKGRKNNIGNLGGGMRVEKITSAALGATNKKTRQFCCVSAVKSSDEIGLLQ